MKQKRTKSSKTDILRPPHCFKCGCDMQLPENPFLLPNHCGVCSEQLAVPIARQVARLASLSKGRSSPSELTKLLIMFVDLGFVKDLSDEQVDPVATQWGLIGDTPDDLHLPPGLASKNLTAAAVPEVSADKQGGQTSMDPLSGAPPPPPILKPTARYIKLADGSFGICGDGKPPKARSEVLVKTKAGDLRTEKVLRLVDTDGYYTDSGGNSHKHPYDWLARIEGQRPTRRIPPMCPKCG